MEKEVVKKAEEDVNVIKKCATERDLEMWEVAGLTANIEPRSKPSDLFAKLAEKRKIRHENILKKLTGRLNDINSKTEENIKMSSMDFKSHADHFENELNKMKNAIDNPEIGSNESAIFLNFYDKSNEFKAKQQQMVEELYEDLNRFEDSRSRENELVLRDTCEEMRKAGHLLPYEVQTFAEQEILKINQLSLNNRRCYNDLKLTLTLVTEQTFKKFHDQMTCLQEKWASERVHKARETIKNQAENKMTASAPKFYERLELKGFELELESSRDDAYSECRIKTWSDNVIQVANKIETHGKNIVEVYKKTLAAAFGDFTHEIDKIVQDVNSIENVDIEERVIKPLYFKAQSEQMKEIEALEVVWQENLSEMKNVVTDVVDFLQEMGNLWSRHRERFDEYKKLILKALEKDDENNGAVLQDLEVKLNVALDNLRQEFNKGKLEKAHEAAIAILNSIKEKYESIYLNQVAIVEDFYKMSDLEVDVLSAEIKEFVYALHTAEPTKPGPYFCEQYNSIPDGKFICKEIQKCVQQVKALKSWKHGMWSALETFPSKAQEYLGRRSETWIQSKIEGLAEKMTIQLELLTKRFERIKSEIYEKRLAEIGHHEDKFDNHQESVKSAFWKMKENLENLTANELKKLTDLKANFLDIERVVKSENRPGVIKTNQIKIEKKKREFEGNCKAQYEIFRADCEVKAANIEEANLSFMKSIKLFSEGGNYHVEEGKLFISRLETTDREISMETRSILKDASKEETEVLKKSSTTFGPVILLLTNLYEETFFHMEINERIEGFKGKTNDLVKRLRTDLNLLEDDLNCLLTHVGDLDNPVTEEHQQHWFQLIANLYKNVSNLFYPMKIVETPDLSEVMGDDVSTENGDDVTPPCFANGKFSTKATVSQTPTFRSTEATEQFPCTNYKWELFKAEDPPQNDGTFMAVVSNDLWIELDHMQKMACSFYKRVQGRKILREDLVEANYDLFASVKVPNLRSCSDQCEQIWLQTILDFLPVVARIKSTANCFLQRLVDDYEKDAFKMLENLEKSFKFNLQTQTSRNSEIFMILDEKLLPLHGHPNNKDLLAGLEEEVVKKTAGMGVDWEAAINRFKNELKCFRVNHLKERSYSHKIQKEVSKLKDYIFVNDLGSNMLDLILEYVDRGGFCTKRNFLEQSVPLMAEIPNQYKLNLVEMNLKTVGEYLTILKDIANVERSNVRHEESATHRYPEPVGTEPGIESSLVSQQSFDLLLPPLDFGTRIEQTFDRMEKKIRKMQVFADSMTNVHEEALFKWLNVWKSNVKKVRKLFTVRYEEKPRPDEKPSPSPAGEFVTLFMYLYTQSKCQFELRSDPSETSIVPSASSLYSFLNLENIKRQVRIDYSLEPEY